MTGLRHGRDQRHRNDVDDLLRIGRRGVVPPRDMAIGTNEHQPPFVERGNLRFVERSATVASGSPIRGGRAQSLDIGGAIEAKQDEAAPEQIERRASVLHPGMRRAMAGTGGLNVGADRIGRLGRSVGHDHRRALIAIAKMDAVGEPFAGHHLGIGAAEFVAGAVAFGAGLEDLLRRRLLRGDSMRLRLPVASLTFRIATGRRSIS